MLNNVFILGMFFIASCRSFPLDSTLQPRATGSGPCAAVGDRLPSQMLRTLPLGASITWGQSSTSGNGYRESLREKLVSNGAGVNMIGSNSHGTMEDNQNEGWPGYRVDEVNKKADKDLSSKPNLVLINAGTNDAAQNYQLDTVDDRLESMINKLFDNIPGTVVIVSTLLYNRHPATQARIEQVNKKYTSLVQDMADSGKLVYLSDMSAITASDINSTDGTHPTDAGYVKMAGIWYDAVQEVYSRCWLTAPAAVDSLDDSDS